MKSIINLINLKNNLRQRFGHTGKTRDSIIQEQAANHIYNANFSNYGKTYTYREKKATSNSER